MNKAKIINLAVGLVDSTEEALMMRDQSQFQNCKKREKQIIEEANSKPIMPKVFDDWYKDITAESSDIQGIVTYFKFTIDGKYNNFGPEKALFDWVHSGKYNRVLGMNLVDENRYRKCLEAILYGYEFDN